MAGAGVMSGILVVLLIKMEDTKDEVSTEALGEVFANVTADVVEFSEELSTPILTLLRIAALIPVPGLAAVMLADFLR